MVDRHDIVVNVSAIIMSKSENVSFTRASNGMPIQLMIWQDLKPGGS